MTRPSCGYQHFLPNDLYLEAWPTFWKLLALLRTFELWVLEFIHFTWIFLVRPGLRIQDLTEAGPAGRNRFPPHVHSNLGTFQTSKQWEQGSTAGTLLNFKKKFKYTLLNKFGPSFRKLVDFFIAIHSGNVSDIQRGCGQRDSLSFYIFFYGAEILAIQIKQIIRVSSPIESLSMEDRIFANGRIFF